jgi:hypothetical protein
MHRLNSHRHKTSKLQLRGEIVYQLTTPDLPTSVNCCPTAQQDNSCAPHGDDTKQPTEHPHPPGHPHHHHHPQHKHDPKA